jgi:hypothetical protein
MSSKKSKNKASGMFNFLEKLLVFCTMDTRSVPAESGNRFGVCMPQDDGSVCILFKIDQQPDFLFQQKGVKRPDYLAAYIRETEIICTIIEMKGKDRHEMKRGVEQIVYFKGRLVKEFKEHLPAKFLGRTRFQGILLAPHNSQVPERAIAKQGAGGLVILPLRYSYKADLYPFVKQINKLTDSNKPADYDRHLAKDRKFHFIERLLVERNPDKRLHDSFLQKNFRASADRRGIYINRALNGSTEYLALMVNSDHKVIAVRERSDKHTTALCAALDECGHAGVFQIERIILPTCFPSLYAPRFSADGSTGRVREKILYKVARVQHVLQLSHSSVLIASLLRAAPDLPHRKPAKRAGLRDCNGTSPLVFSVLVLLGDTGPASSIKGLSLPPPAPGTQ